SSGTAATTITMRSLLKNLEPTLDLLEERLFRSTFTQEDLDRLRQQQIESIQAGLEQPSTIAANVYSKLVYGDDHSLAVPTIGEVEALLNVTLEDVEAFSQKSLVSRIL